MKKKDGKAPESSEGTRGTFELPYVSEEETERFLRNNKELLLSYIIHKAQTLQALGVGIEKVLCPITKKVLKVIVEEFEKGNNSRQIAELHATVIRQLPDLTKKQRQAYIEKPSLLAEKLRPLAADESNPLQFKDLANGRYFLPVNEWQRPALGMVVAEILYVKISDNEAARVRNLDEKVLMNPSQRVAIVML